jgi:hypothetical protein
MAVRRYAMTLANAQRAGADASVNITKSSPGGSLTGSNIVEFNIEDTTGSPTKADILKALEALENLVVSDSWPPA